MSAATGAPTSAADRLLGGPDWQFLSIRDKRVILEHLRQLDEATAPTATDPLDVDRARIRAGGPIALMVDVLPPSDLAPFSPLHRHLNAWHVAETQRPPGAREGCAAARGHAKTTVGTEFGGLYQAAYATRKFIVIASDTWEQARDRVQAIVQLTETNDRVRALYPGLRPAIDQQGQRVAWRDDDVIFANGVRIKGVGAGKSIRGLKTEQTRPDLLILDDLEDEDSVRTPEALEARRTWLTRVALALGSPLVGLSVLWVGSILSRTALLNAVTRAAVAPGQQRPQWARTWTRSVFPAEIVGSEQQLTTVTLIDDESGEPYSASVMVGQPMWAGGMTREALGKIKASDADAYAAEYLCDPSAGALALLAPPIQVQWLNPTAPPLQRLVRLPNGTAVAVASMTRACALDPQYAEPGSKTSDPDLAAVVVAGQYGAHTFLLDAWVGRDRHGQARRLVNMGTRWGCYVGGVEAVAAQVLTADAAAAFGSLPIVKITRQKGRSGDRSAKVTRALGLQQRLGDRDKPETCRVYVLPDCETTDDDGTGIGHGSLSAFLAGFPTARYDDPVDACVDAVTLAARGQGASSATSSTPTLSGARVRPAE